VQRTLNHFFFLGSKLLRNFKFRSPLRRRRSSRKPTLIDLEILQLTHDDRQVDHVVKFVNTTRPRVRLEQIEALLVNRLKALSRFPRETVSEVPYQQGKVFCSFSQGRHLNRKHVQPVKQVAPKCVSSDSRLQVAVGGGDHPNISVDGTSSTHTLKFVLLQNA
jgi:hypothetical protein